MNASAEIMFLRRNLRQIGVIFESHVTCAIWYETCRRSWLASKLNSLAMRMFSLIPFRLKHTSKHIELNCNLKSIWIRRVWYVVRVMFFHESAAAAANLRRKMENFHNVTKENGKKDGST